MKDYSYYLDKIGEIGFVDEVMHSILYVSGLPGAHPNEVVIFESGQMGTVFSLFPERAEILKLSSDPIPVGTKVVRTNELFQVRLSESMLGRVIDPLGYPIDGGPPLEEGGRLAPVDNSPHGIVGRKPITSQFETGISIVDMVVPLGKGQRELVIGDRKTGKTEFLLQSILAQAGRGSISIYCIIGARQIDILKRAEFIKSKNVLSKTIFVATTSADPSGLIFLSPYTAMTIAEYFRDKGLDVLLILDDLTTHARFYREISLLARRFPGKGSYPGDIFYVHARIMERAGNYQRGSITCLPVAESILGDLSGYIQTNLMSMTDGHLFFDIENYNRGLRPAINPELSVTRVGHQTQSPLLRETSRRLSNFLVEYEKMKQFTHFGAEAGENVKSVLGGGERLDMLFNQPEFRLMPLDCDIAIIAGIWSGAWNETDVNSVKSAFEKLLILYLTDEAYRKELDALISAHAGFDALVNDLKANDQLITSRVNVS